MKEITRLINEIISLIPEAKESPTKDVEKLELSIALKKWAVDLEKYLESADFIVPANEKNNIQIAIGKNNNNQNNV